MNFRSVLIAIVSLGMGAALLALLVAVSGVRLHDVLSRLATMDRLAFFRLTILIAVNAFLSSQKWRLTDRVMRRTTDAGLSRFESFALTSMGTALGQVLPVQVSMPIVRTLGTWIHGRALRRGTLGTFFEQAFDVMFVCFLMIASAGTHLLHGGPVMWSMIAVPAAVLAIVCAGTMLNLVRRLTGWMQLDAANSSRWRQYAAQLNQSGLLEPGLGRKLMSLSAVRFLVLVLMAGETTAAIHAGLPLWHLAAAMPFAVLATAFGITPGGLGLTEFTYAGVLSAFGTPLAVTTQWALANRLLVSAGSIAIGVLQLPFFFAFRATARRPIADSAARLRH